MTKPNGMNIKEVAKAMQTIEFILFTVKVGDIGKLHAGEAEQAHKEARKIMEEYLKPLGAFEEEEEKPAFEVIGYFVDKDATEYNANNIFVAVKDAENSYMAYCPIGQHSCISLEYITECKAITKQEYIEHSRGIYTPAEYLQDIFDHFLEELNELTNVDYEGELSADQEKRYMQIVEVLQKNNVEIPFGIEL